MSELCQICGSHEAMPLVHQEPHLWVRCPDCGFAWISPMPDHEEAGQMQDDATGRSYVEGYLAKFDSKMRNARHRARLLARRMPGPRLLDVGSNIGCMVAAAAERGLDATGVEINPVLVEEARRRFPDQRFLCGAFEDLDLPDAGFDGVYCSEVIEHVVDTNLFLAGIARVMRPGGTLFLTTPALREYARGGDPKRWRHFGAPDHKLYYSAANIRSQLVRHGFDSVRVLFNFGRGIKLFATRTP